MTPDTAAEEIRRFEEQYRLNPDSLVFARLADAYRRAGDTGRALEILEQGIERHPDYPSAFIIRARTFSDMTRFEEAEEALRTVLDLDAQNQVAMLGLADLAERRGAVSEALGWQERIVAAYPQNQEALAALERLRPLATLSRPGLEDLGPPAEEWWSSSTDEEGPPETADPAPEEIEPVAYVGFDPLTEDVAEDLDLLDRELGEDGGQASHEDNGDFVTEIFGEADEDATGPAVEERDGQPWWFEDPSEVEPADDGDLLTRTMADLYARQGLVDEAAAIYRELLAGRPDDAELLRALAEVEARLVPEPAPDSPDVAAPVADVAVAEVHDPAPEPEAFEPEAFEPEASVPEAPEDEAREDEAPDFYASHPVPREAAGSDYFREWLRRLTG